MSVVMLFSCVMKWNGQTESKFNLEYDGFSFVEDRKPGACDQS